MEKLSSGEQNLVSLGAALGSNCAACAEHYIREARKGGFTDQQIDEAIRLADGVRRVPAQNALDAALGFLFKTVKHKTGATPDAERSEADQGRGAAGEEKGDGTGAGSQPPHRKSCCC